MTNQEQKTNQEQETNQETPKKAVYINRPKAIIALVNLFKFNMVSAKTKDIFDILNSHYSTKKANVEYKLQTIKTPRKSN